MISKKLFNQTSSDVILFSRSQMLRHADFHQFEQVEFEKPVSPHSIHKNLREKIENLGCSTDLDHGPSVNDYWHMTVDNGELSNVEADYITFEGRIIGSVSKERDWPWWRPFGYFIAILLMPIIIGFFIWSAIKNWEKTNPKDEAGDLYILYSGTYQRPEKLNTQIKDWVIGLDVMISYNAAASGINLIRPVFNSLVDEANLVVSSKTSEKLILKKQNFTPEPMLSSKNNDDEV